MFRHLCTVFVLLSALACGTQAQAACTAGNPRANLAESTPTTAFTEHGDGTVTHSLTGLMWQQCSVGQSGASCATGSATSMSWSTALTTAKDSTIAGYTDWRLPNVRELESLVETCGSTPSINKDLFPAMTPSAGYWSASAYAVEPTKAWTVSFVTGLSSYVVRTSTSYKVRLVRGGHALDSVDAQVDTIPDAFSFTAQTGVALGSTATSNTINLTGINASSPISISGGSYQIGSLSYTAAGGTVSNGDTVTIQQTASSSPSTLTTATLTIGGVSAAFNVMTAALSSQTITFNNPGAQTFGTSPTLSATASSGLAPTFTSATTGVCTISSAGALTFVSTGTCTINADQVGNGSYATAPQVTQSFSVGPASQAITGFSPAPSVTLGSAALTLTATGGASGQPVVFATNSASTICTVASPVVTFTGVGVCNLSANQAAGGNYAAAPQVTASITITAASQTVTFAPATPVVFGTAPITLTASASSGLMAFTFSTSSASSICTVSGSTLTIVGVGTCALTATQAGNATYTSASANASVVINPAPTYAISVSISPPAGGSATCTPNPVTQGATSTCTATPASGYSFSAWSGDCSGATCSLSNVTSSKTVSASFTLNSYSVTPLAGANGSISPATVQTVTHGATVAFVITPENGYGIASASGCGGGLSGKTYTTGPVKADCSVSVTFSDSSVTGVCGDDNRKTGLTSAPVNLCSSGTPSLLYGSGPWNWTCNGSNGGGNASCSASASSHTVSTSAGTGGSLSPASRTVVHGGITSLSIAPQAGYVINTVSGCSGSLSGVLYTTGAVTADCTVSATFSATNTTTSITSISPSPSKVGQTVRIDYSVAGSASITGSDSVTVKDGSGNTLCSATVTAATCSTSFASSGSKTLIASYTGTAQASSSLGTNHLVADSPAMSTASLSSGVAGVPYAMMLVASGGVPPYSFSASGLPVGFGLSASGLLSGTAGAPVSASVNATVTDSLGQSAGRSYTLDMVAQLTVATTSLPEGLVNAFYEQHLLAVGGKTPYTWQISSGALPGGLLLDASTGVLSGTPTDLGTSASFTVQVQDINAQTANQTLTLITLEPNVLKSVNGQPVVANLAPSNGGSTCVQDYLQTVGLNLGDSGAPATAPANTSLSHGLFKLTVQGCSPGQTQLRVTLLYPNALPAGTQYWKFGKTADKPTDHWYVLPSAIIAGNSVSFSITDGGLGDDDLSANGSITDPGAPGNPLLAISGSPGGGQVASPYSAALSVSNGTGPYNWSIASGDLPSGITLNAATGQLSGTSTTVGTFNFTVQLVDTSNNASTTRAFSVTMAAAAYPIEVNVNPADAGSASCAPNPVSAGGTTNCSATPNAGYNFTGWSGDCSGASCNLSNVQATKSVTARFTAIPTPTSQTVTFAPTTPVVFGTAPITLTASTSSGLTEFNFGTSSASSICTVSGSTLTIVGVGTCALTATQTGNTTYASASTNASVVINPAAQAITGFAPASPVVLGSSSVTLTATGGASGQPVVFATSSASTICTVASPVVTFTGFGVCNLSANQAAGGNYAAALQVTASITINGLRTASGPSPAGGTVTAEFSGGNASCFYATTTFTTAIAPTGVSMPHGVFGFTTTNCGESPILSFTITYPQALPVGTKYYKFGPTTDNPADHWYVLNSAVLSPDRTQFTFSIVDNGLGDSNPAVGLITDPGGPGVTDKTLASIPTLSEWGMILLSGLMALFGLRHVRRKQVGATPDMAKV